MNRKPISPTTHAIIDYAFSAVQIVGPSVLKLDKSAIKTYAQLGTAFLAVNSVTDTPLTTEPQISFRTHQKSDLGFLAMTALLTVTPMIRRNKKTLFFHLGFLALAAANYLLTDYKAGSSKLAEPFPEDEHNRTSNKTSDKTSHSPLAPASSQMENFPL